MNVEINHATLKAFIRDALGCGCPEEVFENMTCQKETLGDTPGTLIQVGGRLLVFIWTLDNPGDIPRKLADLVKAGRSKRDTLAFNRFRLVLLTEETAIPPEDIQDRFLELIGDDDKAHLHILQPATVPTFILG